MKKKWLMVAALTCFLLGVQAVAGADEEIIKLVQTSLNAAGYDCGTPDGYAGSVTRDALHKFQTDHSLEVSDELTAEVLKLLGIEQADAGDVKDETSKTITLLQELSYADAQFLITRLEEEEVQVIPEPSWMEENPDLCRRMLSLTGIEETEMQEGFKQKYSFVYEEEELDGTKTSIPWIICLKKGAEASAEEVFSKRISVKQARMLYAKLGSDVIRFKVSDQQPLQKMKASFVKEIAEMEFKKVGRKVTEEGFHPVYVYTWNIEGMCTAHMEVCVKDGMDAEAAKLLEE